MMYRPESIDVLSVAFSSDVADDMLAAHAATALRCEVDIMLNPSSEIHLFYLSGTGGHGCGAEYPTVFPVAFFLLSVFPLVTVSYACPPPLHWQYKASRVSMAFIVACRSCRRKGWPRGRVGVWDFIRSWLPPVDVVGEEMRVGVSAPSKSVTSTIARVGCCEVHERLL
jgi:hypothetical protein